MYTRLYTNVLNRYHAVDFCAGFHHCYADSGLFGISMSVYPQFAARAAEVIAQQLHALTGPMGGGINEGEFKRAKNMLKSTLVMALESRLTAVEGESFSFLLCPSVILRFGDLLADEMSRPRSPDADSRE